MSNFLRAFSDTSTRLAFGSTSGQVAWFPTSVCQLVAYIKERHPNGYIGMQVNTWTQISIDLVAWY